jgi:hypothetical protein
MRQQYTFTKQGSMVPLKNVEDVNMQYHLDCNDDVKTETVWMRCKKKGRKYLVASCGPIPCVLELEPFLLKPS